MQEFIYGNWAIVEAIRAGRRVCDQLILADGVEEKGTTAEILTLAKSKNIPIKRLPKRILNDVTNDGNHQGAALRVSGYPYVQLEDILQTAEQRKEKPFILLLDLLKDPQNVRRAHSHGRIGGGAWHCHARPPQCGHHAVGGECVVWRGGTHERGTSHQSGERDERVERGECVVGGF
jgi:hypothetical protein